MPMKNKGRKVYRTMQGKTIDMDLLRQRNELTPAVGNARVNARGDQLGPGGKIVKKREDLLKDYYGSKDQLPEQSAVSRKKPNAAQADEPVVEKDLTDDWEEPDTSNDWVEDADGNFVKKGA